MLEIGGTVLFVDPYGKPHKALITNIWGDPETFPAINLIFVVDQESMTDSYGRQVARDSSVVSWKSQSAHGRYYIPLENGEPIAPLNEYVPYYNTEKL